MFMYNITYTTILIIFRGLSVRGGTKHLKWSVVPPDFKDIHENCSNF